MLNVWPIYLHWVVLGVNVGKYTIHWASAYMLHMYSHWKSIGNDFGTSLHVIRHIGSFVSWESSFPSPFAHQVGVPHRHLKLLQGPNGQNNKKKTNSQHLQVGVPLKPQGIVNFSTRFPGTIHLAPPFEGDGVSFQAPLVKSQMASMEVVVCRSAEKKQLRGRRRWRLSKGMATPRLVTNSRSTVMRSSDSASSKFLSEQETWDQRRVNKRVYEWI